MGHNGDEIAEAEEEEEDVKKGTKKGVKNKKKKKKQNGEHLAPFAKRIMIDDIARQKDYYGKDYRAERVVVNQKFVMAIARIAIIGEDPKACDAFRTALVIVNEGMRLILSRRK